MNLKLLSLGIALGVAGLMAFSFTLEATSTQQFCLSCHEMDIPYQRLMSTPHGSNRHGVVAECADCHIPKSLVPKMLRKIEAAREVWGHLLGTLDTPEAYAAHRETMRNRELARLRSNNSAECRGCHVTEQWQLAEQSTMARNKHEAAANDGRTCIDCHQGIAHPEPVETDPGEAEQDFDAF